jgi:hypothetical protein
MTEEMITGSSHVEKIGRVVLVDIMNNEGRQLVAGVLQRVEDNYDAEEILSTVVVVAGKRIKLDWDSDTSLSASIEEVAA